MENSAKKSARARALRAAQVVTLGLAIMGCSASHGRSPVDMGADDAGRADAEEVDLQLAADASMAADAAFAPSDAGVELDPDAGPMEMADAGGDCPMLEPGDEAWVACCNANGWDWERGCQAWGPYVPPGDSMPQSRAQLTEALLGAEARDELT